MSISLSLSLSRQRLGFSFGVSPMGSTPPQGVESPPPPLPVTNISSSHVLDRASPWSKNPEADVLPKINVVDSVASIQIPDEVFTNPESLWRRFVVRHFIGDAPHVGSIHATVNRIWMSSRDGSKIDVQFIEKNIVLFQIENAHLRARVIWRRY